MSKRTVILLTSAAWIGIFAVALMIAKIKQLYPSFDTAALFVGAISAAISLGAYNVAQRTAKIMAEQRITEREYLVNSAFVDLGVRTPFSEKLKIPPEREAEFAPKAIMLLHQLTLYREIVEHRDLMPKKLCNYRSWAYQIFRPWILSDIDIHRSYWLVVTSGDANDREFIEELALMSIPQPMVSKAEAEQNCSSERG